MSFKTQQLFLIFSACRVQRPQFWIWRRSTARYLCPKRYVTYFQNRWSFLILRWNFQIKKKLSTQNKKTYNVYDCDIHIWILSSTMEFVSCAFLIYRRKLKYLWRYLCAATVILYKLGLYWQCWKVLTLSLHTHTHKVSSRSNSLPCPGYIWVVVSLLLTFVS